MGQLGAARSRPGASLFAWLVLTSSVLPLALAPPASAGGRRPGRPSIVLIVVDDLGYGDLGAYGNREVATPHIDSLAREGLRFTDFHANASTCSPTRAALLTGRYPQRAGIETALLLGRDDDRGLAPRERTLAEVLARAGYDTALFGKWHLGFEARFHPLRQGFRRFRGSLAGGIDYHTHLDREGSLDWWHDRRRVEEEGYATDLTTEHAVRFLERPRKRPFFLFVSYHAVHKPFQTREEAREPRPLAGKRAHYREMIATVDEGVGRILAVLEERGLHERTLVFLTSDNGGVFAVARHEPFRGSKGSLREAGHRVPTIARWPGRIPAGQVTDTTAMTMDLFPTFTALARRKLRRSRRIDGEDLRSILLGEGELRPRTLFWRQGSDHAVRRGPWKLLFEKQRLFLFDLENDPGERTNLAEAHPDLVLELQARFAAWERNVDRPSPRWWLAHSRAGVHPQAPLAAYPPR